MNLDFGLNKPAVKIQYAASSRGLVSLGSNKRDETRLRKYLDNMPRRGTDGKYLNTDTGNLNIKTTLKRCYIL